MIPTLRDGIPSWGPTGFPESTAYEAGFLVSDNAGWREKAPRIDSERCVGCSRCYLYCPDGAISMKDGKAVVDYGFCKGCGICVRICAKDAVTMEAER